MRGFNKVILCGNITRTPETRYTASGTAIGKFGLAINRTWRDSGGNQKEEVTFVDVDCFGKSAETIAQYCKKGSAILIEGRLKLDVWEDKQSSQKRSRLGVVAESFQFLDSKPREQESNEPPPRQRPEATKPTQDEFPPEEDSVPF